MSDVDRIKEAIDKYDYKTQYLHVETNPKNHIRYVIEQTEKNLVKLYNRKTGLYECNVHTDDDVLRLLAKKIFNVRYEKPSVFARYRINSELISAIERLDINDFDYFLILWCVNCKSPYEQRDDIKSAVLFIIRSVVRIFRNIDSYSTYHIGRIYCLSDCIYASRKCIPFSDEHRFNVKYNLSSDIVPFIKKPITPLLNELFTKTDYQTLTRHLRYSSLFIITKGLTSGVIIRILKYIYGASMHINYDKTYVQKVTKMENLPMNGIATIVHVLKGHLAERLRGYYYMERNRPIRIRNNIFICDNNTTVKRCGRAMIIPVQLKEEPIESEILESAMKILADVVYMH